MRAQGPWALLRLAGGREPDPTTAIIGPTFSHPTYQLKRTDFTTNH